MSRLFTFFVAALLALSFVGLTATSVSAEESKCVKALDKCTDKATTWKKFKKCWKESKKCAKAEKKACKKECKALKKLGKSVCKDDYLDRKIGEKKDAKKAKRECKKEVRDLFKDCKKECKN